MKLYLLNYKKKPNISVEQFLLDYYKEVRNYNGTPATFLNIKCNAESLQCGPGKSRSFTDMYYLTKTYFPTLTEKTFTKKLIEVMKEKGLKLLFCNAVQKAVIHPSFRDNKQKERNFFDSLVFDYCGALKNQYDLKGKGEYSLLEIMKLAGYKDNKINKEIKRLISR